MNTQPEINVTDIFNAQQIIKVAMDRGTFKAEEYSQVGGVFDKLSQYIKAVQEQVQAQQEVQESVATEEQADETTTAKKKAGK